MSKVSCILRKKITRSGCRAARPAENTNLTLSRLQKKKKKKAELLFLEASFVTTCTASAVQRYKSLHSEYSLCRSRSGERSTSLYTYTLSGAFSTFACLSKSFTAAFQACNLQFLHHNLINQIF